MTLEGSHGAIVLQPDYKFCETLTSVFFFFLKQFSESKARRSIHG